MKLQQDLQLLAGRIAAAQSAGKPYLLVLGKSCADAANLPSLEELSKQNGITVGPGDRGLIERMLYSFPVPTFYLDLANLARSGYFPRIISTGYDNFLERALFDLDLRPGHHFESIDVYGRRSSAPPTESSERMGRLERIRIIHTYAIGDEQMDPTLLSDLVAPVGSGGLDVVLVGYRNEAPPVEAWLTSQSAQDLWWVSDEASMSLPWNGNVQELRDEDGAPETFFGKLGLLLASAATSATDAGHEANIAELASSEAGDLDYKFAKKRLDQLYATKGSIEQRAASSGVDPAAASQLEYQAREIANLEQQIAGQSLNDVVQRMSAYNERLAKAASDPDHPVQPETAQFFNQQLNLLIEESGKSPPNRTIVTSLQQSLEGMTRDLGPLDRRVELA